jgi:hypothetical protein
VRAAWRTKSRDPCRFADWWFVVHTRTGLCRPFENPKETAMNTVQPIPPGMTAITPHLVCCGAADAIAFYARAFGAVELGRLPAPDGRLMHAMIRIGDASLMLVDEFPEQGMPGALSRQCFAGDPPSLCGGCGCDHGRGRCGGRHGDDAAGRHVLGRSLRSIGGSLRSPVVGGHPRARRQSGGNGRCRGCRLQRRQATEEPMAGYCGHCGHGSELDNCHARDARRAGTGRFPPARQDFRRQAAVSLTVGRFLTRR